MELDKTNLKRIEHVLHSIQKANPKDKDPEIPFELLIASCYPTIWTNIQTALANEHMAGYLEGLEAAKEENLTNE